MTPSRHDGADDRHEERAGVVRWTRRTGVLLIALLGVALAAGVTYAANHLVSQPIGLTSEPVSLGQALAPPATGTGAAPSTTPRSTGGGAPADTLPTKTTTTPAQSDGDADNSGGPSDHDDD